MYNAINDINTFKGWLTAEHIEVVSQSILQEAGVKVQTDEALRITGTSCKNANFQYALHNLSYQLADDNKQSLKYMLKKTERQLKERADIPQATLMAITALSDIIEPLAFRINVVSATQKVRFTHCKCTFCNKADGIEAE